MSRYEVLDAAFDNLHREYVKRGDRIGALEAKLREAEDFGLRLERFAAAAGDAFMSSRAREFLADLRGGEEPALPDTPAKTPCPRTESRVNDYEFLLRTPETGVLVYFRRERPEDAEERAAFDADTRALREIVDYMNSGGGVDAT